MLKIVLDIPIIVLAWFLATIPAAQAETKSYIPYDLKMTNLDFDACLKFISDSPAMAKGVNLELGEPIILAENMADKLLVVKFPMKTPIGDGFALITCVDGAVVRGQYLYDTGV